MFCSASAFGAASAKDWDTLLGAELLAVDRFEDADAFVEYVRDRDGILDCLVAIVDTLPQIATVCDRLLQHNRVLPAIVVLPAASLPPDRTPTVYHNAVTYLVVDSLTELQSKNWLEEIEQAIAQFVQVSPSGAIPTDSVPVSVAAQVQQRQRRLAEKLRERLGYAGVYYKRDPDRFYRHLSSDERTELLDRLQDIYRSIILDYFKDPDRINPLIDEFVALAFLADMSVSQVLELHMTLMDRFTKQLKLERRNEEIVLDYRITLIDVIAHLSEMYRRSIPRTSKRGRAQRGAGKGNSGTVQPSSTQATRSQPNSPTSQSNTPTQ